MWLIQITSKRHTIIIKNVTVFLTAFVQYAFEEGKVSQVGYIFTSKWQVLRNRSMMYWSLVSEFVFYDYLSYRCIPTV